MGEINWAASLLISLFLSIPVSILSNILTPRVQRFFENRQIYNRGKSLEQIKTEYQTVKKLHEDPQYLQLSIFRATITLLGVIVLEVSAIPMLIFTGNNPFTRGVLYFMCFVVFLLVIVKVNPKFTNLADNISRLMHFEKYENETLKRIEELETKIHTNTKTNTSSSN